MDAKAVAREQLDTVRESLIALSHRIHANPELGFQEERACAWVAEALANAGFAVETGICDLPTALLARAGSGPLHIAICAEYDCLPGIGHACGHNLIAAMAVGAGSALARVADEIGLTISVLGTPAEEAGGGKIVLLDRGAFAGMHAAMMVHPAPVDVLTPRIIACTAFNVEYSGKAAHAAAFPELGINAADAMTIAQVALGLLRQHLRATDRIHGILTKGGDAPNIIPAHTAAQYMIRANTFEELQELSVKVRHCFEAGALATGATLHMTELGKPYAHLHHDAQLAALYQRNAEALGRTFFDSTVAGSTDMGNVSLVLPTIHPMIGINSLPAVNHQPEFTDHCITQDADQALLDGALAMAWTAIDLATDDAVRRRLLARS